MIRDCTIKTPTLTNRLLKFPIHPIAAVSARGKYWQNGREIKISFEDGTNKLHARTLEYIKEAFSYVNLSFVLVPKGQGDVRISYTSGGSWSYVGTDNLLIPKNQHTMQFGWLTEATDAIEFRRVVLHEFFHMFGMLHEQGHPEANIPWDKPRVYSHYRRTQGWSEAEVDAQVFTTYDEGVVDLTEYDPKSLMHYPVPNEFTIGDYEVGFNVEPSPLDLEHLRNTYPKATLTNQEIYDRIRRINNRIINNGALIDEWQARIVKLQQLISNRLDENKRLREQRARLKGRLK